MSSFYLKRVLVGAQKYKFESKIMGELAISLKRDYVVDNAVEDDVAFCQISRKNHEKILKHIFDTNKILDEIYGMKGDLGKILNSGKHGDKELSAKLTELAVVLSTLQIGFKIVGLSSASEEDGFLETLENQAKKFDFPEEQDVETRMGLAVKVFKANRLIRQIMSDLETSSYGGAKNGSSNVHDKKNGANKNGGKEKEGDLEKKNGANKNGGNGEKEKEGDLEKKNGANKNGGNGGKEKEGDLEKKNGANKNEGNGGKEEEDGTESEDDDDDDIPTVGGIYGKFGKILNAIWKMFSNGAG